MLSLNSPAVVCNHRPRRISISKIYLKIGEMYRVYFFGYRCPIPNGIQACLSLVALPLYPTITLGVPETAQGCHKSVNIQLLCLSELACVEHSLGTNELMFEHVASDPHLVPQGGCLDPPLSKTIAQSPLCVRSGEDGSLSSRKSCRLTGQDCGFVSIS